MGVNLGRRWILFFFFFDTINSALRGKSVGPFPPFREVKSRERSKEVHHVFLLY